MKTYLRGLLFAILGTGSMVACTSSPSFPVRPNPSTTASHSHKTGSFQGFGGFPLYEQSWHPEGAVRAVLVIHHGLKDHSKRYGDFANRLTKQGFAVYAYDMRGHGRSSGPRARLDNFNDLIEDLDIFLGRVRQQEPNTPIFLLGHSVGGAVVTLYTLEKQPNLAGLIVMAPAIRIDRQPLEAGILPVAGTLLPNFPALDTPDRLFSRDPQVVQEMGTDPYIYHERGPARTGKGLIQALATIWAKADELKVPILGMHGTADELTDPRGTVELLQRSHSTDQSMLLYQGLYHDLIHEPEREQVMTDCEQWLQAHITPKK
jgi:acylglycerol lipase